MNLFAGSHRGQDSWKQVWGIGSGQKGEGCKFDPSRPAGFVPLPSRPQAGPTLPSQGLEPRPARTWQRSPGSSVPNAGLGSVAPVPPRRRLGSVQRQSGAVRPARSARTPGCSLQAGQAASPDAPSTQAAA